jgi:hypothetical protein
MTASKAVTFGYVPAIFQNHMPVSCPSLLAPSNETLSTLPDSVNSSFNCPEEYKFRIKMIIDIQIYF